MEITQGKKEEKKEGVKCLVIGDLHFKTGNLIEMEELCGKIIDEIKKIPDLDFIVVLGDILDRHENINVFPLCYAIDFLCRLHQISKLFLLIGNHDRPNNSDFLSPFSPFSAVKNWENVRVVDTTYTEIIKGTRFTFVPYVFPGRFPEALNLDKEWGKSRAIFTHQEFKGCKMGKKTSEKGDHWDINNPLIISGHIHNYQVLQKNIIYVGTPIVHNFGEKKDKAIQIFNFFITGEKDGKEGKEGNVKDGGYETFRVGLDISKKLFLKIDAKNLSSLPEKLGINTKIEIKGTAPELKSLEGRIKELVRMGVKIKTKEIESEKEEKKTFKKHKFHEILDLYMEPEINKQMKEFMSEK